MSEYRNQSAGAGLIGRYVHLATLQDCFDAARAGAGQVVFLAGDAGVGKTSLIERFADKAAAAGSRVLASAAFAPESTVPYALFVNVLRPLLRLPHGGTSAGSRQSLLEKLVAADTTSQRLRKSGDHAGKTRLFESIYDLLSRESAEVPLVILLDDLQWADPASVELLHYLGRSISRDPIVMVGVLREGEWRSLPELSEVVHSLVARRGAQWIELASLDREQTQQLVTRIRGQTTPEALLSAIFEKTGGNPFFIEEIIKAHGFSPATLLDQDDRAQDWSVPPSVRDAIMYRLRRLPIDCRRVIEVAAVFGTAFSYDELRAVIRLDDSVLLAAVEYLKQWRLLAELRGERPVRFACSHPLLRETLYSELGAQVIRLEHLNIANAMETLYSEQAVAHAEQLAYHLTRAGDSSADQRAVDYLAAAAERALAVYDNAQAIRYSKLAIGRLAPDDRRRLVTLETEGRARYRLGQFPEASASFRQALAACSPQSDRVRIGLLQRRVGSALWRMGDRTGAVSSHMEGLRVLENETARESSAVAASLRLELAQSYLDMGRVEEAISEAERAIETAGQAGALEVVAHACTVVVSALAFAGDVAGATAYGQRALRAVEECGALGSAWNTQCMLSALYIMRGEAAAADPHIAAAADLAERTASPALESRPLEMRAIGCWLTGNWSDAVRFAERALELDRRLGQRNHIPRVLAWLGVIYSDLGRWEEADVCLREASSSIQEGFRDRALTELSVSLAIMRRSLAAGRSAVALATAGPALQLIEQTGLLVFGAFGLRALAGEASLQVGQLADAQQHAEAAWELSQRLGNRYGQALAARVLGRIASAEDDEERAVALFESSLSTWEALPVPFEAANTAMLLGNSLLRLSRRDAAVSAIRQALAEYERLGTEYKGAEAKSLLRSAGVRLKRAPDGSVAPPSDLTGRELEIIRLVSIRMTTGMIADRLSISPRTAHAHLRNVFRKLGVNSRGEMIAVARTQHILDAAPARTETPENP